jgi:hypothetical protein
LPLAHFRSSVDLACVGIKSGKQVQCPGSLVAMLQTRQVIWSSGTAGGGTHDQPFAHVGDHGTEASALP